MRRIIAAQVVSVDGFIEGPNRELDWVDSWEDPFDLLPQIDTCILGGGMYPGYEQYRGAILANPEGVLPFSGKVEQEGDRIRTLRRKNTAFCPVKDFGQGRLEEHADRARHRGDSPNEKTTGKDMHAVGGATFGHSLNDGLKFGRSTGSGQVRNPFRTYQIPADSRIAIVPMWSRKSER
jgi:hypothetical protein